MKQLLQNLKDGSIQVLEVPDPTLSDGFVLVRNAASLVSAGTERSAVAFGQQHILQKARSRPHLVKQVLDKVARDGLVATYKVVTSRLGAVNALGYSCSGVVMQAGKGVDHVKPGDLVACAGAGYASHAEYVTVPQNLVVKIPSQDHKVLEQAAFTTLGAIALQGIRLGNPLLGEVVAVIGLGLLGQITVQLLLADGCQVVGFDPNPSRVELAQKMGIDAASHRGEDFLAACQSLSNGHGADLTLITAAAAGNNQPIIQAGLVTRDKGKVVAVGEVGLNIPRREYYYKELEVLVSRSYGPGRYDPSFEEKGSDYPYSYVRWTEQRNMQAFVGLLSKGSVDMSPIISHRFPIEDASKAYSLVTGKIDEPYLGILITYNPAEEAKTKRVAVGAEGHAPANKSSSGTIGLGVVGAGGYTSAMLLPEFKKSGDVKMVAVSNRRGVNALNIAQRHGFAYAASDMEEVLNNEGVDLVVIGTPHNLHSQQVIACLGAGKHVHVEKPLCLDRSELAAIQEALDAAPGMKLMVGFNRRFSPLSIKLAEAVAKRDEPMIMHYRVNAGFIPADHWTQDPQIGGGRLLGEGCHFIDWMCWLTGSRVKEVYTLAMDNSGRYFNDNFVTQLRFADGSLGTLTYVANGSRQVGKERAEVFCQGKSLVLDDYKALHIAGTGGGRVQSTKLRSVDKGQERQCRLLIESVRNGGPAPIPQEELLHSTLVTLLAHESMKSNQPIQLDGN